MAGLNLKSPINFIMLKSLRIFSLITGNQEKERKRTETLKYLRIKQCASKLPMEKREKSQGKFLNILKWIKMKTQSIKFCGEAKLRSSEQCFTECAAHQNQEFLNIPL